MTRGLHYGERVYDPTQPVPPRTDPTLVMALRPRRRGRLVAIIVGLVALGCCVAGVTAQLVGQALRAADAAKTATPTPGIGDAVRDGQFEFVVSDVSCGRSEIVNGILRAQAQGQFCVIEVSVTNTGREARRFADGDQRAYGPGGEQYAADTGAGVVANGDGVAVWNVVNPGNSIHANVVYDIPTTATLSIVELHDSGLSGGVRVSLSG
jgi:hypothetical protein